MTVKQQLENIDPSVKGALFRRIMSEEDLGYLREEDSIIGFELDLDTSNPYQVILSLRYKNTLYLDIDQI